MGVVDTNHGMRVTLEKREGDALRYLGTVSEDDARFAIALSVDDELRVTLDESDAPAALGERVRLIVRTALKQAQSLELPPPRRITRWRPPR